MKQIHFSTKISKIWMKLLNIEIRLNIWTQKYNSAGAVAISSLF